MNDYIVYRTDAEVVARGAYDGKIAMQDRDATRVLQYIADLLGSHGGGRMTIGSGLYEIAAPIRLPSMATVQGNGRATVLKLSPANARGVVFHLDTREATVIADLTLQGISGTGNAAGVLLAECGDCEVRGVHARDFAGYGIALERNCFTNKVIGCTTWGNGKAGILIKETQRGRGGDWTPNLILGCTSIGELGHGMELEFAICTNIVGCQVYQPGGHGFYFHSESNSTCLTGSRVYQGAQNGILVENSHELNVSSNIICWNKGHGIELSYVVWGTVSANNFIDNGGRTQQRYGIYIHTDTHSVEVTANAIFNWEGHKPMLGGIYESADCGQNQISHNTINYYTGEPVTILGRGSIATNNLGVAEKYVHPGPQPFPTQGMLYTQDEFTHERVRQFLALTRR